MLGKTNAGGAGGGFVTAQDAVIYVTAPAESTVTIIKGGVTKTGIGIATEASGTYAYIFTIKAAQFDSVTPWTVYAVKGSSNATTTVTINASLVYTLSISYRLPMEYREVTYLRSSTHKAYVDTGIAANTIGQIVMNGKIVSSRTYGLLFGATNKANDIEQATATNLIYRPYDGRIYVSGNGYFPQNDNAFKLSTGASFSIDIVIENASNPHTVTATINGATRTSASDIGAITSNTFWLFNANLNGAANFKSDVGVTADISDVQLYGFPENNERPLLADLIPCERIADEVLGFWDSTNSVFRASAGSGMQAGEYVS